MHRLLIVDDEPIIVDGLYECLRDSHGESLELYRATSAQEAIALLDRVRIDIIICDIRMPGMDGLELLGMVKNRFPRCRVIMLTGYDEFGYIYSAMRHDGVSYLLKTESYERIVETVSRHVEEIEQGYRDQTALDQARLLLREVLPRLREEYLAGLLEGSVPAPEARRFAELEIPLDPERPIRLALAFPCGEKPGAEALTAFRLTAERELAGIGKVGSSTLPDSVALLLQVKEEGEQAASALKAALELAVSATEVGAGLSFSLVASRRPVPWTGLASLRDELRRSWYHLPDRAPGVALDDEAGTLALHRQERGRAASRVKAALARLADLELLLDRGEREALLEAFGRLTSAVEVDAAGYPELAAELRAGFSLFFLSYLRANELDGDPMPREPLERLERLDRDGGAGFDGTLYLQVIDALLEHRRRDHEDRARASVERVKRHVAEHLHEDLSLERLADVAFFCPKYLSRVFRHVTGVGFLEYVNGKRLERAKELLALREWKVSRVGAAVGYQTPAYFTRFFKRLTGMSPQEYRDTLARREVEQR